MLGKRRLALLLGLLGTFLLVVAVVIAASISNEGGVGISVLVWILGEQFNLESSFAKLIALLMSVGVALFGASLMLVAAMMYFRDHLGMEQDWSDWSEM